MVRGPSPLEDLVTMIFDNFYAGKRVLVTGHTGFKGGWLSLWLWHLGAQVHGVGLKAPTEPSLHEIISPEVFATETECDLRDVDALQTAIGRNRPDIIFHLAAQALVRRSYREPLETFDINARGTAHLLEAVRRLECPTTVLVVTTDKCYENRGWDYGYRETDPLGGHDVYSMSKAAAELVTHSWRESFFRPNPKLGQVASARAGNVIGGGDYAEDRLVPDAVRALLSRQPISVRNPSAIRPWQHVLDCLSGYLLLGARLAQAGKDSPLAGAFNFGPGFQCRQSVQAVVQEILRHWPGQWNHAATADAPHEATLLNLAIDKAAAQLQWSPTWGFPQAIGKTALWYHQRHVVGNPAMRDYSLRQITDFVNDARSQAAAWAGDTP